MTRHVALISESKSNTANAVDYVRLGRKHARKALKEFFAKNADLYKQECEHEDQLCDECMLHKAIEVFHDVQLRDSLNPNLEFNYPPDSDSEKLYNNAALELITHVVKNAPRVGPTSDVITHPEEAYSAGHELMAENIAEVMKFLGPDDFKADDLKKQIAEKSWQLLEAKMASPDAMPKVHSMMKKYYDRGIHDALLAIKPPEHAPVTAGMFISPKRAARYEKLLMTVSN